MILSKHRDSSSDDFNARHFGENVWEVIVEQIEDLCSVDEVFSDETIAQYAHDELNVDDVYDEDQLEKWALDNGYVKKDEQHGI